MGREASSLRRAVWRLAMTKQGDLPSSATAAAGRTGAGPAERAQGLPAPSTAGDGRKAPSVNLSRFRICLQGLDRGPLRHQDLEKRTWQPLSQSGSVPAAQAD